MKHKETFLIVSVLVISSVFIPITFLNLQNTRKSFPNDFYLGVTAGGNVTDTKRLIDKTKDFTNLLIITNLDITKNRTRLEETMDYACNSGLSVFVYMVYPSYRNKFDYNPFEWVAEAEYKYRNQFLGYYLYDEPGGNQLDLGDFKQFGLENMPYDYRDAANTFVYYLYVQMRDFIKTDSLVTSDYGLYWYDYEAGYDTVFCEFGWNHSRAINIALCRGAAEMHNKTWGVMITWKYNQAPYIESPSELYQDMITAYKAGAKYVAVFNYPNLGSYGLLTEEHFDAIRDFKDFVNENPQNETSNKKRVAYLLPDNYGWGFRSPDDKIWGVWSADEKSEKIWNDIYDLIERYEYDFDIVYGSFLTLAFWEIHYEELIWWDPP